ncbi:vacuolar protein sorting-associated protein 33B [Takifugu rubripes]|uniref:VPS33B late endosome and lysosome associated n=1 Tax=Takifugu rubripes TaxID=31033 RepID=H2UJI2_TAKRU|nr:vacuolar protein sorting-associated protein 33B [Takifugu rubripes]|eukprot:XP_003969797.1 PREDICTED: vacuolar protein sorting-associated protein 33B [Takifugu rubripes]
MAHSARKDSPELPDFSYLKSLAKDHLIDQLRKIPGKKDLFIEPDLMSPLDRIANVSTLKQHEVDKLFKVEYKPIISTSDQLCFLIRPRIQTVKWICDVANADKAAGRSRRYNIIFTPQKFYACDAVLEEQGLFEEVTTYEWEFYLLPLDDDIISLELPEFFRDSFLAGDQRWVRTVSNSLCLLQSLYGPFSNVYGIGRISKMVEKCWREQGERGQTKNQQAKIGKVFLIDRDVDFVTPLCSQVVYEGLVDDIFRIKCGCVEFGPDVTSSDRSTKVMLNSQDKVFNQIRNEHFSNVFGYLSQKARNLQTAYDKRQGMDIKQMKAFVSEELKSLKQEHRLLSMHISASESIMKTKTSQDFQELLRIEHSLLEGFDIRECISFIEEHIIRQASITESMRLLCLLSMTENGLLSKDYRSLKTQFLQSYGTDHLFTFANLRQLGLLVEQQPGETLTVMESKVGKLVNDKTAGKLTDAFSSLTKKSHFRALSRKLNLVPKSDKDYDLRVPKDMAYIFSGAYNALSCKIIEQVLERDSWTGLEEVTRLINSPEFTVTVSNNPELSPKSDAQRIIFVMFLGGCTFSEISALRFLGKEKGYRFIVVTTAITNSSRMMEALLENRV